MYFQHDCIIFEKINTRAFQTGNVSYRIPKTNIINGLLLNKIFYVRVYFCLYLMLEGLCANNAKKCMYKNHKNARDHHLVKYPIKLKSYKF